MDDLMQLNPYIRYAGFFYHFAYKNETHIAYDCRLFFLSEGKISLTVDGVRHLLRAGDAIFLPPTREYCLDVEENEEVTVIIFNFDCECRGDNPPDSLSTPTPDVFCAEKVVPCRLFAPFDQPLVCNEVAEIRGDCERIVDIFHKQAIHYREQAGILLKRVLLHILKTEEYHGDPRRRLLDEVKAYIFENACAGISNEDVAQQFGYHSYYLNRLLLQREGTSLNRLILARKIQRAEELISSTDRSITEVALEVGFANIAYFSRMFKEKVGMTPNQFRKRFRV